MPSVYVDIVLLSILFIFATLALLKGFVKDFFSTFNLLLAAILSYFLSPVISKFFIKSGSGQIFIDLGIRFVVFIAILIICSIVSSKISKPLAKNIPDSVDQSLGFAFGLAKGYFIIAFMFAITIYFYSYSTDPKSRGITRTELVKREKTGPDWLLQSKSYTVLSWGADALQPLIDSLVAQTQNKLANGSTKVSPADIDTSKTGYDVNPVTNFMNIKKVYDNISDKKNEDQSLPRDIDKKSSKDSTPDDANSGYTKQEIEKMKRLIEIMSN